MMIGNGGVPIAKVQRFLEPGPVVLVSFAYRGQTNILTMTMGWHVMIDRPPR
jgi:hypothetical protein